MTDITNTDAQKFRSLEEVKRFLQQQSQDLDIDRQLVDRAKGQLARMVKAAPSQVLDFSGGGRRTKRTSNIDFPVVKVPNKELLQEHYAQAEKLSERYKFVTNTENEFKMNFAGEKGGQYELILGQFQKLKQQIEQELKELFQALAQVAEGHAPKQFKTFVQALADEIESNRHIEADGLQTMIYAALDKAGKLVFGAYIILINAVNDHQKMVPHLYIVIKWTVGENVELFIENEFVVPTLLHEGTTIDSLKSATHAIASQMALEGFSSQIGNLPVSMQIREPIGGLRPGAFSVGAMIKDVKAQADELIFVLKTAEPSQVNEIMHQLHKELTAILKKKRSTTVRGRAVQNVVTFTFSNLEHGGGIHPIDLEFLEEKYGLDQRQLRRLVNVINGE
jgi:hypothetical protein